MPSTKQVWDTWELIAIKYLQKKWYKILDTNFKFGRFGEIDIIAQNDWLTCFIEVKFRKNIVYGIPEEAITKTKLAKFWKTIEYYCMTKNIDMEYIQFDVITILKWNTSYSLKHYKNLYINE